MSTENGHWYGIDGQPHHWVEKKDGSGRRPTTLRDAKLNNWLPSVTAILQILSRPQLERWKMIQAATAVLTSPRRDGEGLDAFMDRVLFKDEEHKEEAAIAADLGTEIHAAMEDLFAGKACDPSMLPWIEPATKAILERGERVTSEKILVGQGYAGKCDLIQEAPDCWILWDFKSSKNLPDPKKGAWTEARLQLSAYAAAFSILKSTADNLPIRTANCYISTVTPGAFVICENPDWRETFKAFQHILEYWVWLKGYRAQQ